MEASPKHPNLENVIKTTFGFDRVKVIASNLCAPHPIGCGQPVLHFRDAISEREYKISALCQKCQDKLFGCEEE